MGFLYTRSVLPVSVLVSDVIACAGRCVIYRTRSGEKLRQHRFWRSVLAEFLGTFMLLTVVLGSSCLGIGTSQSMAPPIAAGLSVVSLVQSFGEISGAQLNPAITSALVFARKLDILHGLAFAVAQCLGGICVSAIFYLSLPASIYNQLVTRVSSEGNAGQALGMEIISTFQLAFTIFAVDDRRRRDINEPGSLAIGFSLTAGGLAAGHFSGGSMNPARSLGPALLSGIWEHHWVYWIGPILGAFLAGASYEFFFASSASREKLVACLTCKDIEIVEAASISRSSLSMATQTAARTRPTEQKHEQN
ncbi:lens fiber major intrinsic protein isoform X3 [Phyllobates terribilis]|uniref:lens fiber major intrinsic protein isoform X3 n=1 Tax=Phyllobates terribilis TaxID=111132 RepID=UPI003CCAAB45